MWNINQDLKKTILSNESIELAKEYSELALDGILEQGALKDIPIIGTVLGLYKLRASLKERSTIKKILLFLKSLDNISGKEKGEFLSRLDTEDKQGDLMENLLIALEQLDEPLKAEMMGNLFRAYIQGALKRTEFLRFRSIISKAFVGDLINLYLEYSRFVDKERKIEERFEIWENSSIEDFENTLFSYGLMNQKLIEIESEVMRANGRSGTEPSLELEINELGSLLADLIFYNSEDEDVKAYFDYRKKYNNFSNEVVPTSSS